MEGDYEEKMQRKGGRRSSLFSKFKGRRKSSDGAEGEGAVPSPSEEEKKRRKLSARRRQMERMVAHAKKASMKGMVDAVAEMNNALAAAGIDELGGASNLPVHIARKLRSIVGEGKSRRQLKRSNFSAPDRRSAGLEDEPCTTSSQGTEETRTYGRSRTMRSTISGVRGQTRFEYTPSIAPLAEEPENAELGDGESIPSSRASSASSREQQLTIATDSMVALNLAENFSPRVNDDFSPRIDGYSNMIESVYLSSLYTQDISSLENIMDRLEDVEDDIVLELDSGVGAVLVPIVNAVEYLLENTIDDLMERQFTLSSRAAEVVVKSIEAAASGLDKMIEDEEGPAGLLLACATNLEMCMATLLDTAERVIEVVWEKEEMAHSLKSACTSLCRKWISFTISLGDGVSIEQQTYMWLTTADKHARSVLQWIRTLCGATNYWASGIYEDLVTDFNGLLQFIALLAPALKKCGASNNSEVSNEGYKDFLDKLRTSLPPNTILQKDDIIFPYVGVNGTVLGHGSFGSVLKAKWFGLDVALKSAFPGESSWGAFTNELNMISTFHHPRIISFLGVLLEPDKNLSAFPMMMMECMPHGSLYEALEWIRGDKKTITRNSKQAVKMLAKWERRLKVALDICSALCYMHQHCRPGLVHRDVKSANILLDGSYRAKLADFSTTHEAGRACALDQFKFHQDARYLAPEVIVNGSDGRCETSTDVFSFGVLLWELMVGEYPWGLAHSALICFKIATEDERLPFPSTEEEVGKGAPTGLQLLDEREGSVTQRLKDLVNSCWQRNYLARPKIKSIQKELESIELQVFEERRREMEEAQARDSQARASMSQAGAPAGSGGARTV